jgi:regulator of sirC expression with transglutaminase-like and TPR domain
LENAANESEMTQKQDLPVALAWVRGEIGVAEVARALGLSESSTNEIYRRLSEALKAYLQRDRGTPPARQDAKG